MNERQATVLALICVEWDGVLTHLRALRQVGCHVPDEVMRRVVHETTDYSSLWSAANAEWWTYEESVRNAREWLTRHEEVADMISGSGRNG